MRSADRRAGTAECDSDAFDPVADLDVEWHAAPLLQYESARVDEPGGRGLAGEEADARRLPLPQPIKA